MHDVFFRYSYSQALDRLHRAKGKSRQESLDLVQKKVSRCLVKVFKFSLSLSIYIYMLFLYNAIMFLNTFKHSKTLVLRIIFPRSTIPAFWLNVDVRPCNFLATLLKPYCFARWSWWETHWTRSLGSNMSRVPRGHRRKQVSLKKIIYIHIMYVLCMFYIHIMYVLCMWSHM